MIVHDFRNPLSTLQIILNLLRRYPDKIDPEKHGDKLDQMLSQTEHMNRLIDDVLMIGQMDDAHLDFDPHYGDLAEFCRTLFEDYAQTIDKTRYKFTFSAPHRNCATCFDPNLVMRAINNLLSNAVKYSPTGGMLRLEIDCDVDSIAIRLSDSGIGIPEEDLDKLFEFFAQKKKIPKL